MSRSFRHVPVSTVTTGRNKPWKRRVNRSFRFRVKSLLARVVGCDVPEGLPTRLNEVETEYTSPGDGKRYFGRDLAFEGNPVYFTAERSEAVRSHARKLMRK